MPAVAAAFLAIGSAISDAVFTVATAVGVSAGTATAIGASLGGFVAALGGIDGAFAAFEGWSVLASLAISPHPTVGVGPSNPVTFKADLFAGNPYVAGRTGVAGNIVATFVSQDDKNSFLNYITVLSVGPVTGIDSFTANNVPITFNNSTGAVSHVGVNWLGAYSGSTHYQLNDGVSYLGTNYICTAAAYNQAPPDTNHWATFGDQTASSKYPGYMWQEVNLGPDSASYLALPSDISGLPNGRANTPQWTSAYKLSGLAATRWIIQSNPAAYPAGTPRPMWVVRGPPVYDPRLDSTYPGGSGSQRSNDQTTWAYSENPYLHALTWCLGRTSNGVRVIGVGAPIASIDVAAFVTGANVADANGWKLGLFCSSNDSKWDVLVAMLQAGGGVPLQLGAQISCIVNTPRVSIATLTGSDIVGPASVAGTQPRRDRINTIRARYRSEPNGWNLVDANVEQIAAYVTEDGQPRSKPVTFSGVQDPTQCAQLANYAIYDSREFGPVTMPLKPRWLGIKPGDAITVNEPELLLNNQLLLCVDRKRDPATMIPTLTFRSETTAKHGAALAVTGTPPPTPSLTGILPTAGPPSVGAFTATNAVGSDTGTAPILLVTGAVDDLRAAGIIVDYRQVIDSTPTYGSWVKVSYPVTAVSMPINVGTAGNYEVHVRYLAPTGGEDFSAYLDLGTVAVGTALVSALPDVSGLKGVYVAGITNLTWDAVSDYRNPDYEIRLGTAWATSPMIARTSNTHLSSLGDGTYWVAAHYTIPNGQGDVYSGTPASYTITGGQLTANVIATQDEAATSWTGTLSNATVSGGFVQANAGSTSASYTIPSGHRINIGYVPPAGANVIITYAALAQPAGDDILALTDVLLDADILGGALGSFITVTPQIRISQTGSFAGTEPWINWTPGQYVGQLFDFRVLLTTSNTSVIPVLTALSVSIDVPTRTDYYTSQSIAAGGSTLTYSAPFNNGPGGASQPNVQVQILSATAGDDVIVSSTLSAATVQVKNGGVGVARNVNITARGY